VAVSGVLFDVDGTLVDSGYIHTLCWWQALRQDGRDVPMATIHRAVGMGSDRLVPHVLDDGDDELLGRLTAAHDTLYSTYWSQLRLLPGARELVRRCHDAGLITVLASSAGAAELDVLRRVLDIDDALDFVTSADDADSSKPAPDLVQVALSKAGLDRDEAVFIGDAVWDVESSGRAGVRCLGVECGGTSAAELRAAGAAATYRDPADLLEHWGSTPLTGG
jgi:HAD superfamily hydrolase (TIGR01509 family)